MRLRVRTSPPSFPFDPNAKYHRFMQPDTAEHTQQDDPRYVRRVTFARLLVQFRTTILTGLFLLMPFGVLLFLAFQVWKLLRKKMYALTDALGVGAELRLTTALVLTAFLVAVVALIAGHLVRIGAARMKGRGRVERTLLWLLPGYGLMRVRMAEKLGQRSSRTAALLRTPLGLQPVMIMESDRSRALVFLPNAPGANSGTLLIVESSSVIPLNISAPDLDDHLYSMGSGLLAKIPAAVAP
jgi:uncharacterized membrane protein